MAENVKPYPWYGIIARDKTIEQGDFINSCPVIVPTNKIVPGSIPASVKEYDVIVMSQSCDLAERKIEIVLVCPVWPLTELAKRSEILNGYKGKESLRQGHMAGYHLLDKCECAGFESDLKVVDYRSIFGINIDQLEEIAKSKENRLRLLPPYREHLSQAFARFFMRVGLPVDIPKFVPTKP